MKKGVVSIISALAGVAAGAGAVGVRSEKTLSAVQNMSDKHLALFKMMAQWVKVKQEGKNLSEYFERKGYKRIAVYGMSYAGEALLSELQGTETQIVYGIDKKAQNLYMDIDIYDPDSELQEVDAVVVTAITFFDDIEEMLSEKVDCPIISLEDILYEI